MATGLAMFGSQAAISRWKPGLTLKVFNASLGSFAGKRGKSLEVTVGSAADRAADENTKTQRADRWASRFIALGLESGRSIHGFKLLNFCHRRSCFATDAMI